MDTTDSTDAKLGALLDRYQRMRDGDPLVSVEHLRDDAGPLYEEFAELAACLDAVQEGDASVVPTRLPSRPRPRRWRWVLGGLLIAFAGAALWITSRPGPACLRILVHPKTVVLVDGAPYGGEPLSPGAHRVHVEAKGFAPQAFTVQLAGEDVGRTVHLVPTRPFDLEPLQRLVGSYGHVLYKAGALVPRPVGIGTVVDVDQALEMRHPEAMEMELQRFPEVVRGRDDIRYAALQELFRAKLFAESYHAARALAERHPDQRAPWYHCARALWGLELVESPLYAEVLARMDAAVSDE